MTEISAKKVRFQLLGPLRAWRGDHEISLGPSKQRSLLALLLLNAGGGVGRDEIAEFLWSGRPPASAVNVVQTYVRRLRLLLEPDRPARAQGTVLRSLRDGYLLDPEAAYLDLAAFRSLVLSAGEAERSGDLGWAGELLRRAARLRAGAPLEDLGAPVRSHPAVLRVRRELADAAITWARLLPEPEAIGELEALAVMLPLHESLHAALMRAMAATGRRADALSVFQAMRARLRDRMGVAPAEELRRARAEILVRQQPARPPRWVGPPPPEEPLIGREEDTRRLAELVDGRRVTTLTGPGGVGKTALALAVAGRVSARYGGNVAVVELGDLPVSAGIAPLASRILTTLGVRHTAAQAGPAAVAEALPAHHLLVLDNAEHLLPAMAVLVEHVVRSRPRVGLLVTSRRPLDVAGETVWRVPPLRAADTAELLLRAAGRSTPLLDLSRDATLVRELCDPLDGLPLAVELAAARLRSMSPREMLDQIEATGYGVLRRDGPGRLPHQRALTTTVEWSIGLLTVPQHLLLSRLATLPGTFSLAAAEHACARHPTLPHAAALLSDLVDYSLVQREGAAFRLLRPVRRHLRTLLSDVLPDSLADRGPRARRSPSRHAGGPCREPA